MNGGRTIRQYRAAVLFAAFIALLGGAFLTCEPFCCVFEGETEMHAAMPCCTARTAISRPDAMRVQAVTAADKVPAPEPLSGPAVAAAMDVDVARELDVAAERHERPRSSPPLFLTNAQLLI